MTQCFLHHTPTQVEYLLHRLEQAVGGFGFHENVEKTESTCFNQEGNISALNGGSLKLVGKFTYFGSSVSSTENYNYIRLAKAWTAIDRLSIIWNSDHSDKIKHNFFQAAVVSVLLYGCSTWTLIDRIKKRPDRNSTRMLRAKIE